MSAGSGDRRRDVTAEDCSRRTDGRLMTKALPFLDIDGTVSGGLRTASEIEVALEVGSHARISAMLYRNHVGTLSEADRSGRQKEESARWLPRPTPGVIPQ